MKPDGTREAQFNRPTTTRPTRVIGTTEPHHACGFCGHGHVSYNGARMKVCSHCYRNHCQDCGQVVLKSQSAQILDGEGRMRHLYVCRPQPAQPHDVPEGYSKPVFTTHTGKVKPTWPTGERDDYFGGVGARLDT